jgi:LytS/YehU family sensor histidine kinase
LTCDNNAVLFTIDNDNFPKEMDDKSGSGIGLQNLEKRLQLLYPNKFNFKTMLSDGRFVSSFGNSNNLIYGESKNHMRYC